VWELPGWMVELIGRAWNSAVVLHGGGMAGSATCGCAWRLKHCHPCPLLGPTDVHRCHEEEVVLGGGLVSFVLEGPTLGAKVAMSMPQCHMCGFMVH